MKKITPSMSAGMRKSSGEIDAIRESCRIVAEVLRRMPERIAPGVTTLDLDAFAEEIIRAERGEPAFKGYGSDKKNLFPGTICASVDDEVVHGIPGTRRLNAGQIVSVDVGVKKDGWFGDGAWTFAVGEITAEKRRLMAAAEDALTQGIARAIAGNKVGDISAAVQQRVEQDGYSVVRDLVGHGIGRELHEEPSVPNFGQPGTGVLLEAGMTLAIEPMVNAGGHRVNVDRDGWTIRTADGMPSAHFEHTVLVFAGQADILTR